MNICANLITSFFFKGKVDNKPRSFKEKKKGGNSAQDLLCFIYIQSGLICTLYKKVLRAVNEEPPAPYCTS